MALKHEEPSKVEPSKVEPSKVESSTVEHADERGTVEYVDNIETIQDDNYHGLTSQFILIYIVSILHRERMIRPYIIVLTKYSLQALELVAFAAMMTVVTSGLVSSCFTFSLPYSHCDKG
jgi:hypothetical protein